MCKVTTIRKQITHQIKISNLLDFKHTCLIVKLVSSWYRSITNTIFFEIQTNTLCMALKKWNEISQLLRFEPITKTWLRVTHNISLIYHNSVRKWCNMCLHNFLGRPMFIYIAMKFNRYVDMLMIKSTTDQLFWLCRFNVTSLLYFIFDNIIHK